MTHKSLRKVLAAACAVACTTIVLCAQLPAPAEQAVAAYVAAIKAAESGSRSVESVFAAVVPLREALMHNDAPSRETVLEALTDGDYVRLEHELRGVWINRDESVYVKPNVDFFINLASTRGDQVDKAFFAAMKTTYDDTVPVYVQMVTDFNACTVYGPTDLVKLYGVWSTFRRRHPERYKDGAQEEWDAVRFQLTEGTCACGDKTSVERELAEFLRTFPASPDRATVERRLHDLHVGESNFRFNCHPG
jgi:hypothetical protein